MTGGPLHAMGPAGLLLALLVCGHMLGDFVFQNGALVERKRERAGWVWIHVLVVTLVQAVVLAPVLSPVGIGALLFLAVAHGLTDHLKVALERRHPRPLLHFLLDQALHLAAVGVAWKAWEICLAREVPGSSPFLALSPDAVPGLTTAAVIVAAYAFNGTGGAALVRGVLRRAALGSEPEAETPAGTAGSPGPREAARGRIIGILERMLLLTLVLVDQWGALGLVMAAKSIARFEDLKRRAFSEYYLIGTLASLLVATLSGLLVKLVL